ncbi:MAG: hypothetical protein K2I81_00495 [Alphaproteobacteria bacterium]|nr:hypothetical protein [Alphaproteobacteria bacterium]
MTISSKTKKILAVAGGATLLVTCILAMTQCSGNANARDEAQDRLENATARADSLQQLLAQTEQGRQSWMRLANARGDTIQMLRNDTACADSIVVLNDSIARLVAANDSLQRSLNDCRGSRRSVPARRRQNNSGRNNNNNNNGGNNGNANGQSGAQNVNNNNNNSNIIFVPAQGATNVTVNGGNGNTVNVNNGTVNNYYAPAPAADNTVRIESSASVRRTYVVKVQREKSR